MGEGLEMGKIKHWGVKSGSYVSNVELGLDKGTIREHLGDSGVGILILPGQKGLKQADGQTILTKKVFIHSVAASALKKPADARDSCGGKLHEIKKIISLGQTAGVKTSPSAP